MAKKPLENSYELANGNEPISNDDLRQALTDFEFLTGNYMQIVNKERRMVPFKLNPAQKYMAETLWPFINPETRLDRHMQVVVVKPRQIGGTTFNADFINYISAFAEGMENMTILHSLPVTDTIQKLAKRKIEPIITGIHPDIQPEILKDSLGSSIVYTYDNILGVKRRNNYELVSASSSSIRSDTVHIWLCDEVTWYRHPDELEDAVGGAMPDHGFSLTVFLSTYSDKYSDFFLNKIRMAMDNPEDMRLIFIPWFIPYPEQPLGGAFDPDSLNDYERTVIVPALEQYKIPKDQWGDKLLWYRRKSLSVPHMKQENPTTIEEVLTMREEKRFFPEDAIEYQKENQDAGLPYTLMTDTQTKEVRAVAAEASAFRIISQPVYGRKYMLVVDPITAQNEDTDYFAMTMWDIDAMKMVAVFHDKNLSTEDYADVAVAMSKIYNRAIICPETNVGEAFIVCVRALGYYNFYYANESNRAHKIPGLRTTVTTKERWLNKLTLLLQQQRIQIKDPETIEEIAGMEKKTKVRSDGSISVSVAARKGKHDDLAMTVVLFCGTLNEKQLRGQKRSEFDIIW